MPTLDSNEELQQRVRKCFTDTEMEYDEEITYFDTDQTIENLVQLIKADREAAIREARIDAVQLYMDTCERNGVPPSWRNLREFQRGQQQALNDLNQPTKEREQMSFICKTCGGVAGTHRPSQFDKDGVGHPDHTMSPGFYTPLDLPPGPAP